MQAAKSSGKEELPFPASLQKEPNSQGPGCQRAPATPAHTNGTERAQEVAREAAGQEFVLPRTDTGW